MTFTSIDGNLSEIITASHAVHPQMNSRMITEEARGLPGAPRLSPASSRRHKCERQEDRRGEAREGVALERVIHVSLPHCFG